MLEQTPPELAPISAQAVLQLQAAGALLYGIDKRIQESIGIEVKIAGPKNVLPREQADP